MKKILYLFAVLICSLYCSYISMAITSLGVAFALQFLFPAVIGIIAIPWPEWVIHHADKFTSWFICIVTLRFIGGTLIPIWPKARENEG